MCVPFSQCRAVVTEQTKKQLRPQIILGQMRWWWCCLCKAKPYPRPKQTLFNAILGLTAGISECLT